MGRWAQVQSETGDLDPDALARFDAKLESIARREKDRISRKHMWLAHHWFDDYEERCVTVGSRHVCRRCGVLYGIGFIVAFAAAFGAAPWPESWDPLAIWILCIPATVAYCGEAIGLFRYSPRWQTIAMAITALGFGRGLGYELTERWSSEFWGPVAVFGGLWFMFTMIGATRKRIRASQTRSAELTSLAKHVVETLESNQAASDHEASVVD